jgi:drug/metabolite transporter (DMT)-like permease
MRGREWAMLIALSVLWGGSFFFNGVAVKELPSLTLVELRVAVAAAALWLILLGALLLHEALLWRHLLGMALIGLRMVFIDGRMLRLARRPLPVREGGVS